MKKLFSCGLSGQPSERVAKWSPSIAPNNDIRRRTALPAGATAQAKMKGREKKNLRDSKGGEGAGQPVAFDVDDSEMNGKVRCDACVVCVCACRHSRLIAIVNDRSTFLFVFAQECCSIVFTRLLVSSRHECR